MALPLGMTPVARSGNAMKGTAKQRLKKLQLAIIKK
jgi:hypothetical protein